MFSKSSRRFEEFNGRKIIEMGVAMCLDLDKGSFLEKIMDTELCDHTRVGEKEL